MLTVRTLFIALLLTTYSCNPLVNGGVSSFNTAIVSAPATVDLATLEADEDTEKLITLNYTGSSASSCEVSSLNQVTVTQSCACVAGVCTVGVKGLSDYSGTAGFQFSVSSSSGQSNHSNVSLNILSAPDVSGILSLTGVADANFARTIDFSSLSSDESITTTEVCLSADSDDDSILDESEKCNIQSWLDITSSLGGSTDPSLWTTYSLTNQKDGASFTNSLHATCSTTHSYFVSVKLKNSVAKSAVVSTPAWHFWSPSCLTSLTAWFDSSDLKSMFTDVAGTTPAAAGSGVMLMKDKSGNGNDIFQNNPGLAPLLVPNSIGDKPAITSMGDRWIQNASAPVPALNANDIGIFIVYKEIERRMTIPFNLGTGDSNRIATHIAWVDNNIYFDTTCCNYGKGRISVQTPYAVGSSNVYAFTSSVAQDSQNVHTNGQLLANSGVMDVNFTATQMALLSYGSGNSTAYGSIGEFVVTKFPTQNERQLLEGYLAWKWNLQSQLDSHHPYRLVIP